MERQKKGFTLVELLVVIAIIALLMGILMPALSRVRQLAFRLTCGTNLSGIGKAMLIYANDYDSELPRGGMKTAVWDKVVWDAPTRDLAFNNTGTSSQATISSCFYLLVKYAEVTPKSFICKGDTGTTEFSLSEENVTDPGFELIDAWDFGETPEDNCSYSYHIPFSVYALSVTSEPGLAIAADRNPWLNSPGADAKTQAEFTSFLPDTSNYPAGDNETAVVGNATTHQGDGQNVLYLDAHVEFTKRSFCSLEEDNIFTKSPYSDAGDSKGTMPSAVKNLAPANRRDSLLVHQVATSTGR